MDDESSTSTPLRQAQCAAWTLFLSTTSQTPQYANYFARCLERFIMRRHDRMDQLCNLQFEWGCGPLGGHLHDLDRHSDLNRGVDLSCGPDGSHLPYGARFGRFTALYRHGPRLCLQSARLYFARGGYGDKACHGFEWLASSY